MRQDGLTRRTFCGRVSAALGAAGALVEGVGSGRDAVLGPGKYGPATWPAVDRLHARLREWARQHPEIFTLETLGRSAEGRPLDVAILTDAAAPAGDKEHLLVTALHSGIERSGTTAVFHIMKWLLSGEPLAREILRRQVVVFMPLVNPDGYVAGTFANSMRKDPYSGWTIEGPRDADQNPEAVAVRRVMDRFQPEVHTDVHGHSMAFAGYHHTEESGRAYSNLALRPYRHDVHRLMDEAALEEGYPSDQLEQDAERIYGGAELGMMQEKLWSGIQTPAAGVNVASKPRVYAAIYAYDRYHTMPLASEVAWERSALLRHRRLMQIGNEVWPGEYYRGYPTRVIRLNGYHMIAAYGRTAEQRRRSRVELWGKQRQLVHGAHNPQTEGMVFYVCATSPAAAERWLRDRTLAGFARAIGEHPKVDAAQVRRLLENHPGGHGLPGTPPQLQLDGGGAKPEETATLEHGLALRLRIPYPRARLQSVRSNGYPVPVSEQDGYVTWVARGYTYVQLNLPPEKSAREDFVILTCEYDPGERRMQGADWR